MFIYIVFIIDHLVSFLTFNLAASLRNSPKTYNVWSQRLKTSDIYGGTTVQDGDNCMGHKKIYERVKRFKGSISVLIIALWTVFDCNVD
jgi:hypothetical protein